MRMDTPGLRSYISTQPDPKSHSACRPTIWDTDGPTPPRYAAVTTLKPFVAVAEDVCRGTRAEHGTLGSWWLSSSLLLLLGGVFPLIFTLVDLRLLLEPPVLLSFIVTQWSSFRLFRLLIRGDESIVQATFWVFVYVWFGLAALAQTAAQRFPIAGQSFSEETQIQALLVIIAGLAAYEGGLAARQSAGVSYLDRWFGQRQISLRRVWIISAVGIAGTAYALWKLGLGTLFSSRYTVAEALYGTPDAGQRLDQIGNKTPGFLQTTFIWAPAFLALHLLLTHKSLSRAIRWSASGVVSRRTVRVVIISLLVANFLVNNPISGPRYRFGGIALALSAACWLLGNPRRFRLWVIGLLLAVLFAFPLLDIFRFDDRSITVTPLKNELVTSPDFGMFQQEINAQVYVEANGFTFGEQAAGVVFVLVPRAWWAGKPIDTGNVIVRSSAINASASLWATVFVDGGLLAVAGALFAYGWVTSACEQLYRRKRSESSFIAAAVPLYAGFQFILLRGDLQPAVGQLAPLLAMILFAGLKPRRSSPS